MKRTPSSPPASTASREMPLSLGALRDGPPIRVPVSAATLNGFRDWALSKDRPREARLSYLAGAIVIEVLAHDYAVRIPAGALTLEGFRAWATSPAFPQCGRISFLNQAILIDMSPEEIETHAKVKAAISAAIVNLNEELDLGEFFPDGTLVTNDSAGLSTEPDATFVKWQSYRSRRVRLIPRQDEQGEFTEVRGRPDWVLEVGSKSSLRSDQGEMRALYHRAGIPEYWLINARGEEIDFQILVRRRAHYVPVQPSAGWYRSPVFGRSFRLERRPNRMGRWTYKLRMED